MHRYYALFHLLYFLIYLEDIREIHTTTTTTTTPTSIATNNDEAYHNFLLKITFQMYEINNC